MTDSKQVSRAVAWVGFAAATVAVYEDPANDDSPVAALARTK